MQRRSISPLELLEALVDRYETCLSSPAVFDALVRACTQIGATGDAYRVIKKIRLEGCWVTIHAWNNFLNHLLKLNQGDKFWKMYREVISNGYSDNVNTFNLVIYALCKECKLREAMSVFYRMLKRGVLPNVVPFKMLIDGACKMGNISFALELVKKMGVMSESKLVTDEMKRGSFFVDVITYNTLINGYCISGNIDEAFALCLEMKQSEGAYEDNGSSGDDS
ncbi:hypothetical protein HHK36_006590 [Tetracentron sinense]|uniref:Pentatricopeptide repeat-containing protein n=1 Tax=Tetracentron sinense TaxID=13715 RepID=A0A834ZJA0_TETSI|nr:hypothetical protein HHK36_006590 [Tetracentron sinense]